MAWRERPYNSLALADVRKNKFRLGLSITNVIFNIIAVHTSIITLYRLSHIMGWCVWNNPIFLATVPFLSHEYSQRTAAPVISITPAGDVLFSFFKVNRQGYFVSDRMTPFNEFENQEIQSMVQSFFLTTLLSMPRFFYLFEVHVCMKTGYGIEGGERVTKYFLHHSSR